MTAAAAVLFVIGLGASVLARSRIGGLYMLRGVLGVIGPTRINYARIIPMVDHTAKVVSRLLG